VGKDIYQGDFSEAAGHALIGTLGALTVESFRDSTKYNFGESDENLEEQMN